ncbi:capsular exopolysaccharide synthesis family protein [Dyadobacter jejuensis]|uniref:Capsular exopolysaccharide synthesis family protein n=1 Tax=Dyadobacter jejuensis TaxID=1082580 RepID=A0A316AJ74_9BACT|nr:tyrosine-protein kinase [Dyadobacter jejuensis]PWJ57632.1 capsular exopolysaccharide synthesis family protein [Dyadobacter jejuensis]
MTDNGRDQDFFERLTSPNDRVDTMALLRVILSRWHWMLSALALAALLGLFYYKWATPRYASKVTFKYHQKASQLDELTNTYSGYFFDNSPADYLTEAFIIRSQGVVEEALAVLNSPFTFYRTKALRQVDVYPYRPLRISILDYRPEEFENGTFILDERLGLTYTSPGSTLHWADPLLQPIHLPGLTLRVDSLLTQPGYRYRFHYNDPTKLAKRLAEQIEMKEVEEAMPIMHLSFEHQSEAYTHDFTKSLIQSYGAFDLLKKRKSSDLTIAFIRQQLQIFSDSLKQAAQQLEDFKQNNKTLDLRQAAEVTASRLEAIDAEKQKLLVQNSYLKLLEQNLTLGLEPTPWLSMGLDAPSEALFTNLLSQYHQALYKRKEMLLQFSLNAPPLVLATQRVESLQQQIINQMALLEKKNQVTANLLTSQRIKLQSQLLTWPVLERTQLYLQSNYDVNQRIYAMLRDKDLEASILRAGILPTFTVISGLDVEQVAPRPWAIGALAVVLGLLLGIGSIAGARISNSKLHALHHLRDAPKLAFWGIIYHHQGMRYPIDWAHILSDRSLFTESVNLVRSRLTLGNHKESAEGTQILITSQTAGEGKSFFTIHLALSLSKLGKRVLIIDADLRKPQLSYYLSETNLVGLGSFLEAQRSDFPALIRATEAPNLHFIGTQLGPERPAELLQAETFRRLLAYCKSQYQYILLDSAPLALVSDSLPLLQSSDYTLFMARWLRSDRDVLRFARQAALQYPGSNMKLVLTDFYQDGLFEPITGHREIEQRMATYVMSQSDNSGYYAATTPPPWYIRWLSRRSPHKRQH